MPTRNFRELVDGTSMVNTRISVAAGDTLRFECQGWNNLGWSARTAGHIIVDGAGRKPDGALNNSKMADRGYPLPGAVRYGLIGMIVDPLGTPLDTFFIGQVNTIVVAAPGTLHLGANDNNPGDNGPARGHRSPWQVSIDHTTPDPPAPPATPGIRIYDIQILQVARPADPQDTVLVGGKTTVVRAFLESRDTEVAINGFVEVNGTRFPALNPRPSVKNAVRPQSPGTAPDPDETSASLNFEVPGRVLPVNGNFSHHTFRVSVFAGPENAEPGFFHTDQRTVGFSNSVPIDINLLSIIGKDGGDPAAFAGNLSIAGMEEQLPVADGGLVAARCVPPVYTIPDIHSESFALLMLRINTARLGGLINPLLTSGIVLGMIVPDPTAINSGRKALTTILVRLRQNVESTNGTTGANTTAVHELGHIFGVGHAAGCGSPGELDPNLPPTLPRPGWSTSQHEVIRMGTPANMSNCTTKWRTATEYLHIHLRLLRGAGKSA